MKPSILIASLWFFFFLSAKHNEKSSVGVVSRTALRSFQGQGQSVAQPVLPQACFFSERPEQTRVPRGLVCFFWKRENSHLSATDLLPSDSCPARRVITSLALGPARSVSVLVWLVQQAQVGWWRCVSSSSLLSRRGRSLSMTFFLHFETVRCSGWALLQRIAVCRMEDHHNTPTSKEIES